MIKPLSRLEIIKIKRELLDMIHDIDEMGIKIKSNHPGLVAGVISLTQMAENSIKE